MVEAGAAQIEIADRGDPVAETELPGVFRLSAQANRRGAGDGMGIGLAMAQTLVERHGGSIWAENRAKEPGVRFLVRLPLAEGTVEAPTAAPSAEREPSWAGDRVLVVDDNEDAADALCMLFEMKGKTVRVARDGLSAVKEAQAFRPDYIWMDIGLPGISGIEATRQIRAIELEPRPFICALTGLDQAVDRKATAEAGCDLHFTKPIQIDAALAVMNERPHIA